MPLDALPFAGFSTRHQPPSVPSFDQLERNAAVQFVPLLYKQLEDQMMANNTLILAVKMAVDLKDTSVRLIRSNDGKNTIRSDETAIAWVHQSVPRLDAKRRALAVRLASAAAVSWRQHCQIHRLGFRSA